MTASCEPAPRGAFYQSVLAPHPSTPCGAVRSIEVRVARSAAGRLDLIYVVEGDLRRVQLPEPAPPRRVDGLWRHTCFEAFVAPDPGAAYIELNFAPSGAWACYAFERYREGMAPVDDFAVPRISVERVGEHRWALCAAVHLNMAGGDAPARVALAAVIEDSEGRLSYWALRHPPGGPDFHHPESFTLRI